MSMVRMLMGGLRMLHRGIRMLFTLGMIALAVMFSSSAVGLRCILVMLAALLCSSLAVFASLVVCSPSGSSSRRLSVCSGDYIALRKLL
jgi:hypothetical protein